MLGLGMSAIGCGGGSDKFATTKVSGTVMLNGQPVTGGSLTFSPMASDPKIKPGKGASGEVQSSGAFTLTTYQPGDGAIIGKHRITYSAPVPETPAVPEGGHAAPPPKSPFAGAVPKQPEVEIKAGENKLTIELEIKAAG